MLPVYHSVCYRAMRTIPLLCTCCWSSQCDAAQLRECTAVLLMKLLDDKVPALMEGTQLLKALNVLMLKILDNCNR